MAQSYKKSPELAESYDAILIGTGIGCLCAGALLSKLGKKVLLLERHYTAGGFTHVFKRKGFEWDVGIHYIGEVQRPNSLLRKLFDYVSNDQLKWDDMGEIYDRIILGNKQYDFVKGVDNFKLKLGEYFPDEKDAIKKYIDLIFAVNKSASKFYMDKALSGFTSSILGRFMRKKYLKYANRTTYDVLNELTKNDTLIKVLCGQYGDYGLPPKQSSFAMHASVAKHYMQGGSVPAKGSSQILNTIEKVIEKAGGTILVRAEVDKIIIENNKAKGVKLTDGKSLYADTIVSGTGVFNTFENLIPSDVATAHKLNQKLKHVNPSVGYGCLYIGLKGSPDELKLPKTNFWIYPEDLDHDGCVERFLNDNKTEFPLVYISFPAAKFSDWNERYPGKSTIDIITMIPYEAFAKWDGTTWKKRGEDYEIKKEEFAQRLLKHLFKQLPQLKGKVEFYEFSTPLTAKHFSNYKQGALYGIDHNPKRFRQNFLRPKTKIKGLYLTGQDIVTAGVGAALFSGLITASAITRVNFIKKIFNQ